MSRAVTANHVLFDESIDAFRRQEPTREPRHHREKSFSFLLTDFNLIESWQLPDCVIQPSLRVGLPGAWAAFVSRIENPIWADGHNSHLYGIALAAVTSFATGRVCTSTRDDYLCRRTTLGPNELVELALHHPVLVAGPGCTQTDIAAERRQEYYNAIYSIIGFLQSMPSKPYGQLMQAIRLVHLSLLNKRNDFGLAYLLLVSAIETVAKEAISKDAVEEQHPLEQPWKDKARTDSLFDELYRTYKQQRGNNKYLQERYVQFIIDFAPPAEWEGFVRHPLQDMADFIKEVQPSFEPGFVRKWWSEKYPADLSLEHLKKILKDSYSHRSAFVHSGEQPPHQEPVAHNRFFQEVYEIHPQKGASSTLLPNYDLLLGIAQKSITSWAAMQAGPKSCEPHRGGLPGAH